MQKREIAFSSLIIKTIKDYYLGSNLALKDRRNSRNMKPAPAIPSVPAMDLTPDAPSGKRGLHVMLQGVRSGLWVWALLCSL